MKLIQCLRFESIEGILDDETVSLTCKQALHDYLVDLDGSIENSKPNGNIHMLLISMRWIVKNSKRHMVENFARLALERGVNQVEAGQFLEWNRQHQHFTDEEITALQIGLGIDKNYLLTQLNPQEKRVVLSDDLKL